MNLRLIESHKIDAFWDKIEDRIRSSLEVDNEYYASPHEIHSSLLLGERQLWIANEESDKNTIFVTKILLLNYRKTFIFEICEGGEINWEQLLTQFIDYAQEQGCTKLMIMGRRGWKRVLSSYDFKETSVILTKDIERG